MTLICTHEACADEREAVVDDLRELDRLACDCGCAVELVAIGELVAA